MARPWSGSSPFAARPNRTRRTVSRVRENKTRPWSGSSPFAVGPTPGVGYGRGFGTHAPAAPSAPSAPRPGVAGPQAAPAPGQLVDDATAAADRAALRFRTDTDSAKLEQEGTYDRTDFQEALRRMVAQRPKDEQQTRETANREGLFYSGQLGKRLADQAVDFQRRQGDAQTEFDRREAARAAARQALESGASIDDAAITAALADRQTGRDADAAAVGGLAAPPPAAPKKAKSPAKPKKQRKRRK